MNKSCAAIVKEAPTACSFVINPVAHIQQMTEPRTNGPTKEFVVFSLGDSRKASTWSNVPFFFTRTLEKRGCSVHRVNIGPPRWLQLLFDVPWKLYCKAVGKQTRYTFLRSQMHRRMAEAKIAKAIEQYPEGHCIFMTYSFGAGRKREYTLFCDQTFEQHIAYFDERRPDKLERPTILAERRNLRHAKLIIALFPELADKLKNLHGGKVRYYGNVVNLETTQADEEKLLRLKRQSREVVFIGNRRYKEGLELLAKAVKIINAQEMRPITVNVIGMDRIEMPGAPANMLFHGYLNKAVPEQKRTYLDLLERSRLFVNPHPKWAAFSASCEALYLYTPVVIPAYSEFERTFGDMTALGVPLYSTEAAHVAQGIMALMDDDAEWERRARNGHQATRAMSWANYVEKYLDDLEHVGMSGPARPFSPSVSSPAHSPG